MSPGHPEHLIGLQRQRSRVVQGFLWILLGVVGVTCVINAFLIGPQSRTVAGLGPNLVFAGLIGTALWLNKRQGTERERIPLAARIFAVVDVYDALTSNRPYRPAWTSQQALNHIRAGAGSHFDSLTVDAFVQLMHNETQP